MSIFDDDEDNTADISFSVTSDGVKKRHSMKNYQFLNVEDNDDESERRTKRKSLLNENNVVSSPVSRKSESLCNVMTSEQITIHYGTCIKLASENKINQKNAFKLHLIDYLKDNLSELKNFQVATTSLDAGSKIYAGRVDSVHQNTYQVLSGIGGNEESASNEIDNEPLTIDQDDGGKVKKTTKRKVNVNKNLFVTDIKKIRLPKTSFRVDIDPLFQSQAENFDDCSVGQLRLNKLKFLERTRELVLDSDTVVFNDYDDTDISVPKQDIISFYEFNEEIIEMISRPIPISTHFVDFTFVGWQPGNATMNSDTAESMKLLKVESKLAAQMTEHLDNAYDDFVDDVEPMEPHVENSDDLKCQNDDLDPNKTIKKEDDLLDVSIIVGSNRSEGSFFLKSINSFVQNAQENQMFINDSYLGMWAGPDHFKAKCRKLVSENEILQKTKSKKDLQKKEKEKKSLFPDDIEFYVTKDGVGKLKYCEMDITRSEDSNTQLTADCLNKNINKEYVLPPSVNAKTVGSINEMMLRKISLLNKAVKEWEDKQSTMNNAATITKDIVQSVGPPEQIVLIDDSNNYNDEDNCLGLQVDPINLVLTADDEGNICQGEGLNDSGDLQDEGDAYMGNSFANFEDDFYDDALTNIKQVEKIDVQYAKTAKRINVKKLKKDISSYLESTIQLTNSESVEKEKYPDLHMISKISTLSEVLQHVDSKASSVMSKDLSVPIILTCLFFLSNEYGLNLEMNDDFSDLSIGQGYSEYDLEHIRKFGIGKCQKRNSDSSPKIKPKKLKKKNITRPIEIDSEDEDDNNNSNSLLNGSTGHQNIFSDDDD